MDNQAAAASPMKLVPPPPLPLRAPLLLLIVGATSSRCKFSMPPRNRTTDWPDGRRHRHSHSARSYQQIVGFNDDGGDVVVVVSVIVVAVVVVEVSLL